MGVPHIPASLTQTCPRLDTSHQQQQGRQQHGLFPVDPHGCLSFQLLSFLQVGLLCSPSYSAWTGLGCLGCYQRLLLWGAPSSHKTGWTGSGAEAIGSGGFNIIRDGSEKNRAMRETSQDTCTPLQAALLWVRTAP